MTYHWRSLGDGLGYMLLTLMDDGFVSVHIITNDDAAITFNSRGAWLCEPEPRCAAPKSPTP